MEYTLSFANIGDAPPDNVVITDGVPVDGEFWPSASTAGWVCAPDNFNPARAPSMWARSRRSPG